MTQPSDERVEHDLRELLAERGRTANGDVRAVLDGIAALPDRDGNTRRPWVAAAAAIALLVLGGAVILGRLSLPRVGSPAERVGREVFADDARLAQCEAATGTATQVFAMTHAEWFPLYFPGWYRGAPELEVGDPALVVIGPEVRGGILGAGPGPGDGSPARTAAPSSMLCIAVGPPDDAAIHTYGPTHFDRIVPLLSDADVARAPHLDPDVLADPAAWRFPERLAPCGGVTGNELYVFEAVHVSDFGRHFPSAEAVQFGDDDPAAIVVYREPLPLRRRVDEQPYGPAEHDVCVALEVVGARPDHVILPRVDITGLHLRIDREVTGPPILPPGPTPFPSPLVATEPPAPSWAADARELLACGHGPVDLGDEAAPRPDEVTGDSPEGVVGTVAQRAWTLHLPVPHEGFVAGPADGPARQFIYTTDGRITAAVAVMARGGDPSSGAWYASSVASCGDAEFEATTATGSQPFGHWDDGTGSGTVDTTLLSAAADCYGGTQVLYDGGLYVRIPNGGVDPAQLETTWSASLSLPSSAIDTGLRSGELVLFRSAHGGALYVARGDRAERLPHVIGDEIQRTDCN